MKKRLKKRLKNGFLGYEIHKITYRFHDENHEKSRLLRVLRRWRLFSKKASVKLYVACDF